MKPESSVIFFPCRDIAETKAYYTRVLGLPVYKDLGSTVWFDCGYGYLAFVDYGPERPMASGACISFNLPTTEAVDEMYQTLQNSQFPVLGLEGPPAPIRSSRYIPSSCRIQTGTRWSIRRRRMCRGLTGIVNLNLAKRCDYGRKT